MPTFENVLVMQMKEEPFSLAMDGSNDNGLQKMYLVTANIFNVSQGHVTTRFLDMCLTSGSGSATVAKILK